MQNGCEARWNTIGLSQEPAVVVGVTLPSVIVLVDGSETIQEKLTSGVIGITIRPGRLSDNREGFGCEPTRILQKPLIPFFVCVDELHTNLSSKYVVVAVSACRMARLPLTIRHPDTQQRMRYSLLSQRQRLSSLLSPMQVALFSVAVRGNESTGSLAQRAASQRSLEAACKSHAQTFARPIDGVNATVQRHDWSRR